jgi:penicillin-binding protein 1A
MIDAAAETAALAARPRIAAGVTAGTERSGWAQDYLRRVFRDRAGDEDRPGWRVRTTFSQPLQAAAEEAVAAGVARLGRPGLQAALVALDPRTGDLRAMVGGADYERSTFNRAVLASRQSGSAFKPFVYAVALERGDSPATRVPGVLSRVFAQESERLGRQFDGDDPAALVTYREALAVSDNDAALAVQQRVGTAAVVDLARRVGLPPQPEVPSLALGTGSATPLELTASYAPFANGGHAVRPRSITAVDDQRGRTVLREEVDRTAVISPAAAWQALSMLREVVESGTGVAARAAGVPAAGKTGTTDDYRDAWFVGFAADLAVGVWVGYDRPAPIGEAAYAAQVAVPIWTDFVRRAAPLLPPADFSPPSAITAVALCAISHAVPTDRCPSYQEFFKQGDSVPEERCPLHTGSLRERLGRSVRWLFERIRRLFR